MGVNGQCVVLLDLASRKIAGFLYKDTPINSHDITECILKVINDSGHKPRIRIIHSDRESLFKNDHYFEFLKQHGILASRTSAEAGGNMVLERTFRTVKGPIRVKLDPLWVDLRKSKHAVLQRPDPLQTVHNPELISKLVREAISEYNSAPHTTNFGASPDIFERALIDNLLEETGDYPEVQVVLDENENVTLRFFIQYGKKIPVCTQLVGTTSHELHAVVDFRVKSLVRHTLLPLVGRVL